MILVPTIISAEPTTGLEIIFPEPSDILYGISSDIKGHIPFIYIAYRRSWPIWLLKGAKLFLSTIM